jgi:DNA invertase Pin-like site-specific DNA recombinase
MIEQTKRGEINCIVVKDFSRFARSSVDTNEYLELIFPFLNVRFISVVNNYDSDRHKGATAGLEATVPAIIAEMYSRDLSLKVKSAKAVKAKQGDFLGSRAPYGYILSKTVRKRLEIDPTAAEIIKRIFKMAADGIKPADIARTLNSEGIDAPMAHALKLNPDEKCYRAKSRKVYWQYASISKFEFPHFSTHTWKHEL